jgi:diguanylate cyclase (GGDEF)-like protein
VRVHAGRILLGAAALLAVLALLRPLRASAPPWLRIADAAALALAVTAAAALWSLKGRSRLEPFALYALIALAVDGLGQALASSGWPAWPGMALLVAGVAVAEPPAIALSLAALAGVLSAADVAAGGFTGWRRAAGETAGYTLLALAVHHALRGEKARLAEALAETARLEHTAEPLQPAAPDAAGSALRQLSEDSRRARRIERMGELHERLALLVRTARQAIAAHAVLYFDVDKGHERVWMRAADGEQPFVRDCSAPLTADPFAFVLDREQPFYATEYKRLLWALPWYRAEVKVGSLLAVPVHAAAAVRGVLVAESLDAQALAGREVEALLGFGQMAAAEVEAARAAVGQEELGTVAKAAFEASQQMTALGDRMQLRGLLLRSAGYVVSFEAAALAMVDEARTRYVIEEARGWAAPYEGREVALTERTWTAWTLRGAEAPLLLDDLAGHDERMPVLVLDEGTGPSDSLLAVPLRVPTEVLGALVLIGRRGAFDATARQVLGMLGNQAGAALLAIRLKDRERERASRDGLTALYNRREFDRLLQAAVAREERQEGRFALLLLDIDHFKKLNDSFGHPSGDAALRNTARLLEKHLRKGDHAARYGGEEFAAILPGADEKGARQLAERIRRAVGEAEVEVAPGQTARVTVSLGVGVWPDDGREPESLLAAADRALYAAKQGGRDRVVAASSVPPPTSAAAGA